jgi:hypothetical protein
MLRIPTYHQKRKVDPVFGLNIILVIFMVAVVGGIGILGTLFWLWTVVDCVCRESPEGNTKLGWLIVIVFTHLIGALLYFFIRRPERIRELGC